MFQPTPSNWNICPATRREASTSAATYFSILKNFHWFRCFISSCEAYYWESSDGWAFLWTCPATKHIQNFSFANEKASECGTSSALENAIFEKTHSVVVFFIQFLLCYFYSKYEYWFVCSEFSIRYNDCILHFEICI